MAQPRRSLDFLAGALALAVLLFALVARLAPEVERGVLLPFFEEYVVSRVRMLGVELYVDTSSGLADLLTVGALSASAVALAAVATLLARCGAPDARAFARAACGAAFLAADDLLGAHETVGHNLGPLAGVPVVDHPDDLVVGFYGLVVLAFAWRHRALARGAPRWPWLVAFTTGALAVGHDLAPLNFGRFEEVAEVVTGSALLLGVCGVVAGQLRALQPLSAGSTSPS